ncbi:MAG: dienelactone hydrolase family protein [Burkholderiales bacterium]|nr:dienelactone hydrolase family protein [Burkholderiales bacterium]
MVLSRTVVCWIALWAAGLAFAQTAPEENPPAADLREEIVRIPVTVKDLYGRQETRPIPITIYRPAGDGPFPLIVYNHGRAVTEKRAQQGRSRPENFARYAARKGFVVLAPTRLGYWETYGEFDPESSGSCSSPRPEPMSLAASDQVLAAVDYARGLPYVDASRWLVAGTSVGGLTSIATVWRNPPGLVGGLNFAGGTGGNPETSPGAPCSPQQLARLWGGKAREAKAPMLWLYWENDLYWGADNPKRWHQAWTEGGAKAEFHQLPAVGKDGHAGFAIDMDHWVPLVDAFLAQLGFDKPGAIERPGVTAAAAASDVAKVPLSERARANFYQRFLDAKPPRAFAIGARGAVGWASGDWAIGKALGNCERRGDSCRLYAVDDDVVWPGR